MDPKTELTDQETVLVKQLRSQVVDILPQIRNDFYRHDLFLVRYLRARDLDVAKAELMLRQNLEWRQEKKIDQILGLKTPSEIEDNYPVYVCGRGKDGYPVLLFNFGRWNIREAIEKGYKDDFVMYAIKFFEVVLEFCRKITTPEVYYSKVHVILDFEGFTFFQLASRDVIDFICQVIKIFEASYPEILQSAWVINAPRVFQILWAIVKPLLTPRTIAKVQIVGSNRDKWRPDLFKQISPDNFPAQNGGAITTCMRYKFEYGLNVFKTYDSNPTASMNTITVAAGKAFEVNVDVEEGSTLHWTFKTDQMDIGFEVVANDGAVPEVEYCRVDCHLFDAKGAVNVKPGGYKLIFDNSYSRFKNKTLHYNVWVD